MTSNAGRFQKGQHWRSPQPWWNAEWLRRQYIDLRKTTSEIAAKFGSSANNIAFWLNRHSIKSRSMAETRAIKRWGVSGSANPMFGRTGQLNPNWRGGLTPFRQALYASQEWKALVRRVSKRDPVCRRCGEHDGLEIHHIDPVWHAPLLALELSNVIRLCSTCHRKIYGRELWWRNRLYRIVEQTGRAA